MATVFESISAFLKDDDWQYEVAEPNRLLRFGFTGTNGRFTSYAQVFEQRSQLCVYTMIPFSAPEAVRPAVMEFITRANYGMILGNFEMDLHDGEIRYKTSIDVEGAELTRPLARHVVYGNCLTADRYLPGLMAVISGGKSAADAIAIVEGAPPEG